jgi:glycosyltransferase involved in cell wall biosynthesis
MWSGCWNRLENKSSKMYSSSGTKRPTILTVTLPIYLPSSEPYFLRDLLRVFSKINAKFYLICAGFKYPVPYNVVKIDVGTSRLHRFDSIATSLARLARDQLVVACNVVRIARNADLCLFHVGEFRNLLPLVVAKLMRKKIVIFHIGGNKVLEAKIDSLNPRSRILKVISTIALMRFSYYIVDGIACDSPSNAKFGNLMSYSKKIFYLPHLDVDRYEYGRPPSQRKPLVGFVGRLVAKKGIINFVEAAALVGSKMVGADFVIVGDGPLREDVLSKLHSLRIRDKVKMISNVSDEELASWYQNMKIFVLPSVEEGMPRAVLEAMASGAVVITTPVGGLPDVVINRKTGFIIPDNSPSTIAEAIATASNCDLDQLSKSAHDRVKDMFSERIEQLMIASMLEIMLARKLVAGTK